MHELCGNIKKSLILSTTSWHVAETRLLLAIHILPSIIYHHSFFYLCLSIYSSSHFLLFLVKRIITLQTVITVMDFAIHQHELALGMHMSPPSWNPAHFPPHPAPLCCHRALALGFLRHTSNTHWLSILFIVMYMFQDFMQYSIFMMNNFFNFLKFIYFNWRLITIL